MIAARARTVGRRFPDYGWAWPTGELDCLLKAALLPDDEAAFAEAAGWLSRNNIDVVEFREHRLLAAIASRFGKRLDLHPTYPRLAGLQKMLWSRSRLAYREAWPALAALARLTDRPMLIKGASRVAVDPESRRGRVSHDIDLLVRPDRMADAFQIMADEGWQAATGSGLLLLKARAASLNSMNFHRGRHGDLDIHRVAYHPSQASRADDEAIWERASAADLDGIPVLVPSPADRIALAIAHGGLDAHSHSDWLVDVDATVRQATVDWAVLARVLGMRGILVPAAAALTYLSGIGTPVPQAALAAIVAAADRTGPWQRASLLEAKPRTDFTRLSAAARGIVKQIRLWRSRPVHERPTDAVWRGRSRRRSPALPAEPATSHAIPIPRATPRNQLVTVEIELGITVPKLYRRIELELSTETRHIARLRYRTRGLRAGLLTLRFIGTVAFDRSEAMLRLESRPSRQVRRWDDRRVADRYGAIPLTMLTATIGGAPAGKAEETIAPLGSVAARR
jgi:hypothetical protein